MWATLSESSFTIRYRKVQSHLPCATGAAHLPVPAAIVVINHVAGLNIRVPRAASVEKVSCTSQLGTVHLHHQSPRQSTFCDVGAVFVLDFHVCWRPDLLLLLP